MKRDDKKGKIRNQERESKCSRAASSLWLAKRIHTPHDTSHVDTSLGLLFFTAGLALLPLASLGTSLAVLMSGATQLYSGLFPSTKTAPFFFCPCHLGQCQSPPKPAYSPSTTTPL